MFRNFIVCALLTLFSLSAEAAIERKCFPDSPDFHTGVQCEINGLWRSGDYSNAIDTTAFGAATVTYVRQTGLRGVTWFSCPDAAASSYLTGQCTPGASYSNTIGEQALAAGIWRVRFNYTGAASVALVVDPESPDTVDLADGVDGRGIGNEQTIDALTSLEHFRDPEVGTWTHYYFSITPGGGLDGRTWGAGDDSNDGLSPARPKLSVGEAASLIAPFVWIHFKPGDEWNVANGGINSLFEMASGVGLSADCSAVITSEAQHCIRLTSDAITGNDEDNTQLPGFSIDSGGNPGDAAVRARFDFASHNPGSTDINDRACLLLEQDPSYGAIGIANLEIDCRTTGNFPDAIDVTDSRVDALNVHSVASSVNQAWEMESDPDHGVYLTCVGCSGFASDIVFHARDGYATFVGDDADLMVLNNNAARNPVSCSFMATRSVKASVIGHRITSATGVTGTDDSGLVCVRGQSSEPFPVLDASRLLLDSSYGDWIGGAFVITTDSADDGAILRARQIAARDFRQFLVITNDFTGETNGNVSGFIEGVVAGDRIGNTNANANGSTFTGANQQPYVLLNSNPLFGNFHINYAMFEENEAGDDTQLYVHMEPGATPQSTITLAEATAHAVRAGGAALAQVNNFTFTIGDQVSEYDASIAGQIPPFHNPTGRCDMRRICLGMAPGGVYYVKAHSPISTAFLSREVVGFELPFDSLAPTRLHPDEF